MYCSYLITTFMALTLIVVVRYTATDYCMYNYPQDIQQLIIARIITPWSEKSTK